ncbi:urease subunit gamma [Nocardioides eburneiflavus]|uniref:urease n=1 Tax=Nocardioides eburneiflavus TaxID=2518372 RepID=A0A4Z1CHT5_9ACTN|nr:urease subunit gamma [Nocardioides eburneiflavus]TGN65758.1 urease subunit gamma [Nocardioides eburneiflavus]
MHLTPTERDRLLLFLAAELARARRSRGLLLNAPEATALIADAVAEAAREGRRQAEAVATGQQVLTRDEVLPGVPEVVGTVNVEATFEDGTRLVVVPDPFGTGSHTDTTRAGEVPDAVHASGRSGDSPLDSVAAGALPPGTIIPAGDHLAQARRAAREREGRVTVEVRNTGEVPITVTSHFHFFEVNPRLRFDREAAYGRRLALPGGETVRFAPGEDVTVELVDIGGARIAYGFSGYVDGPLDDPQVKAAALQRARDAVRRHDHQQGDHKQGDQTQGDHDQDANDQEENR